MAKERVAGEEQEPSRGRVRSRSRGRGRAIVATVLIGFVLIASVVIWRRSYGVRLARDLADLDRQRTQLEGDRARLRSLIRDESSRSQLAPAAERLGMKVPNDKQVRILSR